MPAAQPIELGRRIVIWGVTGSGKTSLARGLAERLDVPRIELMRSVTRTVSTRLIRTFSATFSLSS